MMERRVYAAIKRTYVEQLAAQKRELVAAVPMLAVLSPVRPLTYTLNLIVSTYVEQLATQKRRLSLPCPCWPCCRRCGC